jgi:WbqC-like protein family
VTTLAIHQPNYLPWPGYFHKMAGCDVFVYLDAVQYPRGRSFAARNRIKTPNGAAYLTVPVSVPKGHDGRVSYLEVAFADDGWRDKHLRTVEQCYARAPHFGAIFPLYRDALGRGESLVEVNIALTEAVAGYLGIASRRVRLSEALSEFGAKTQLIVELCQELGADRYLSGTGGGADYNDEELLRANGIELRYDSYDPPTYPQLWGPFEPRLSVLDLLFNCGPESRGLAI